MHYEPERPLDPPEDKICGYCDFCCGELYEGDAIYNISGQCIHEDCLLDFARSYFADCLAEVRV